VIETLHARGDRLRAGVADVVAELALEQHFQLYGRSSSLVFATRDADGRPSQQFRTLFMQELLARGILAPSFVVTYSHTEDDIDRTIEATHAALEVYARALEDGVETYLRGPSVKPVYRRHN